MNDLIARLESASEGSRELDEAIWRETGLLGFDETHCAMWCTMDGRTDLTRDHYIYAWTPEFTTNLGDAKRLVPGDCSYAVGDLNEDDQPWACVTRHAVDFDGNGATPELALCIACLKARQHKSEAA